MPIHSLLRQCHNNVSYIPSPNEETPHNRLKAGLAIASVASAAFIALRYKRARFHPGGWPYFRGRVDYIARSGFGIKGIEISDGALQLPGQRVVRLDLRPKTFHTYLLNENNGVLPFTWIWKPSQSAASNASLTKYASLRMKFDEEKISSKLQEEINNHFEKLL